MKKVIVVLLLISTFSCNDSKNKNQNTEDAETFKGEVEVETPKFDFPVVDNFFENSNLFSINNLGHTFEDGIVFNEIDALKTGENTYTFIFTLDQYLTDFEVLKTWKMGLYFYAKNPMEFKNPFNQKRKLKTMGALMTPKIMGDEVVVLLENYELLPKEISLMRVYLYNAKGESNLNYYNSKNIILP